MDKEAGTGELRSADGAVWLREARYELVIKPADILGGLPLIRGAILNPPEGGFAPGQVGAEAVLRLDDGREWECALADTGGRLTARGQVEADRGGAGPFPG
ncbi:MAG TPA: hypothetical protein VM364_21465 [Vicinamibacterales bacterium]|nr:hypothetical protein [Vicinamibacterales bacterium]